MIWTEEFKQEMRERHLLVIKIILIFFTVFFPVFLPWYYYNVFIQKGFGIGGVYDYIFLFGLVGVYLCCFIFLALLKRSQRIRLIAWIGLVWYVTINIFILYIAGGPISAIVIIYPVTIVAYSILLHPALATRFFVLFTVSLGIMTWLIIKEIIPFYPMIKMAPTYPAFVALFIKSKGVSSYTIANYILLTSLSLFALLIINYIVNKLRQREEELSLSNLRISRLSEKLKVYLPHQFVESLSQGDRDTEPDYRRRRLTIFFSDVKGFTRWTDRLEPEEVRELLNQYLSEMSKIARKWGGTIDKFIGDSIMIFFGDPEWTNDKDHSLRCVKMSMEMQEKMAELRRQWQDLGHEEPLHIRIGINTGYATVGNFGSEDRLNYTALGSAVNLASRLETICAPDKITISHTIYSLLKDEIECVPKGEVEVKGFSEPIKIYEVVGLRQ